MPISEPASSKAQRFYEMLATSEPTSWEMPINLSRPVESSRQDFYYFAINRNLGFLNKGELFGGFSRQIFRVFGAVFLEKKLEILESSTTRR
ncbi:unnamed protein product [Rhodiola kirilowii]